MSRLTSRSENIKVRLATEKDVDAIHAVHVNAIRRLCSSHYDHQTVEHWANRQKPEKYAYFMKQLGNTFLVAETSEGIVGFGHLGNVSTDYGCEFESADLEIKALYVSPTCTRQGLGKRLVREMEKMVEEKNVQQLVVVSTLNAVRFYLGCGFVRLRNHTHRIGDQSLCAVLMLKTYENKFLHAGYLWRTERQFFPPNEIDSSGNTALAEPDR